MCTALADSKRSLTFANVLRSMIRVGLSSGRIARLLVCAFVALAALAPATASGQPAVDEYTLDIPQAGGGGSDPTDPNAPSSGGGATAAGGADGTGAGSGSGLSPAEARVRSQGRREERREQRREDGSVAFGGLHDGKSQAQGPDTSSRSFPEVIADTVTDGAMLPILAGLVLIAGAGAWRLLRGRRTLTGQAG
jgi:hypothetical protein